MAAGKSLSVTPTDELITELETIVGDSAVSVWV